MKLSTLLITTATLLSLTACSMDAPQTTTGSDFSQGNFLDNQTRQASNVKPLLKFPAKFCVVKMSDGKMLLPQSRELQIWQGIAARNSGFGTFAQINEMTVALVSSEGLGNSYNREASLTEVRAAAARQHCHAILSYQVRKDSTGYVATGLLFDTRNGYTYLSGTTAGSSANAAVNSLSLDFEKGLTALAIALNK